MNKVPLTIATSDYDHIRDIALGRVPVEGVEVTYLSFGIEETFHRFVLNREWEVSEMSFAKFVAHMCENDPDIIGLPVFPSRVFRLSSVFVRTDSDLVRPEQLRGKKIGVPEWAQTAAIYTRGWLTDDVGIPLKEVDWYQAGLNQAGRKEKVELRLPDDVRLTSVPEKSLDEMLQKGEIDAVLSAAVPRSMARGGKALRHLLPDYESAEIEYFRRTGIFPIMHTVAVRRNVFEKHRWIAQNLLKAFEEAKERSVTRALDRQASRFPVPFAVDHATRMLGIFGEDIFPYGIEANRVTLDAFLRWSHEQGIASRRLAPDDLFPPEVKTRFKI